MKYRVVPIRSEEADPADYPNARNSEFPDLVKYVDDEYSLFIVREDGQLYEARDFFFMTDIKEFETDEK